MDNKTYMAQIRAMGSEPATAPSPTDKAAYRLVGGPDESAPSLVDANGTVLTNLKTGDHLVNLVRQGKPVVDGLFCEGDVYLLGSDDKVGKSRSMHVAAYGVAAGTRFLSYDVPRPRDVLFIELDESEEGSASTLRAAVDLGLLTIDQLQSGGVYHLNDAGECGTRDAQMHFELDSDGIRLDTGLGQVCVAWKATHPDGGLVIIDSLSDVFDERHALGQSVRTDKANITAFSSLAHALRCAVLLIHHTTKMARDGSVSDRLQGTRGLLAGVTGSLVFEPEYVDGVWTGEGTLVIKGRCAPRSMRMTSKVGFWKALDKAEEPTRQLDKDVVRIRDWMLARREPWSGSAAELTDLAQTGCDFRRITSLLSKDAQWLAEQGVSYNRSGLVHGRRTIYLELGQSAAGA